MPEAVPVCAMGVARLPDRLSVVVDAQPRSVVIWYRTDLPSVELAQMLAQAWERYNRHQ